jgi:hypothetical protein
MIRTSRNASLEHTLNGNSSYRPFFDSIADNELVEVRLPMAAMLKVSAEQDKM